MNKCENCIHNGMCRFLPSVAKNIECRFFKDKSLFVELPCKVGDKLYAISESRVEECRCYEICIYGNEKLIVTEHNCDYDCKGCPFNSWGQDYSGEHSCQGEYGEWFFKFEDFGKTVFLTKEEAERKLREVGE